VTISPDAIPPNPAELREQNANITLMIQGDMLGYHDPAEPAQLGLPQL
jgi:hypothetical protein